MGGGTPTYQNGIQGVTISSSGGVFDFGDLSQAKRDNQCVSNNVRGISAGGYVDPGVEIVNIEFVTIASTGDGTGFGDLTVKRSMGGGSGDATRGIIMGGGQSGGTRENAIEFITIATLGDSQDFGDLVNEARTRTANLSNSTRAVVAGGYTVDPSGDTTHIDFVTIQTKSNATEFGDLTSGKEGNGRSIFSCSWVVCWRNRQY